MRHSRCFLNSRLGVMMAAGVLVTNGSALVPMKSMGADEKLNPSFYALAAGILCL